MPRPRKKGLEHTSTMTSYLERMPDVSPEKQSNTDVGAEALTLSSLKDVLLKERANITSELKDIKQDYRQVVIHLTH